MSNETSSVEDVRFVVLTYNCFTDNQGTRDDGAQYSKPNDTVCRMREAEETSEDIHERHLAAFLQLLYGLGVFDVRLKSSMLLAPFGLGV